MKKRIYKRKLATNTELTNALTEKIEVPRLPFWKKWFEWVRLTKDIHTKLVMLQTKERRFKNAGLLDYKRSGIPVLRLQLEYLRKSRKIIK